MGDPVIEGNFLNLSRDQLDEHIYRIMPEKYVIELFSQGQNVLSQLSNWKDKFENFQLKLGAMLNGEEVHFAFRDDFVGQCWTRESLSEAMWGIYANDPNVRFLRIRSTPRKLLAALVSAHPKMPQDNCFIGKVDYKSESEIRNYANRGGYFQPKATQFAKDLLLKRLAFKHESEVRLLYFGDKEECDANGLYRYSVNPHEMITQIMGDPNRDRATWTTDKAKIEHATGFTGEIKRSKIYDPPDWSMPRFKA